MTNSLHTQIEVITNCALEALQASSSLWAAAIASSLFLPCLSPGLYGMAIGLFAAKFSVKVIEEHLPSLQEQLYRVQNHVAEQMEAVSEYRLALNCSVIAAGVFFPSLGGRCALLLGCAYGLIEDHERAKDLRGYLLEESSPPPFFMPTPTTF